MTKIDRTARDFELWRLIGKVNHGILLLRQRELRKHHVPVRQLQILSTINDLGSKASLNEIAETVERRPNVISKQTMVMEKDKLITRAKKTPKSNLLTLKLTKKGLGLISCSRRSEAIQVIFSSLSDEEIQQLNSLLNKVLVSTDKYVGNNNAMGFVSEKTHKMG